MVLFWQLPRLEHSRLKMQRNKAFPGCLRKSAPPRALMAGYKLLAAVHGAVVSPTPPKRADSKTWPQIMLLQCWLWEQKHYPNSQFVVVKAATALHSVTGPRAARDWWQSCWTLGPSKKAFQHRGDIRTR